MANIDTILRRFVGIAAVTGLATIAGNANAAEIAGWNAERPEHVVSGAGTIIQLGGGPTASVEAGEDRIGGTWSLRGIVGTRSYIGGELAYVGAARDYDAEAVTDNATLLTNGGEVAARLNLPIGFGFENQTLLEPYAFGGIGYMVHSVAADQIIDPQVTGVNDFFTLPVGGGVTLAYNGVALDTRVGYRPLLANGFQDGDLFQEARPGNEVSWTTSLGVEF